MRTIITLPIVLLFLITGLNAQTFTWIDGYDNDYQLNPFMTNAVVASSSDGTIWFAGLQEMTMNYIDMMGPQFLIQYNEDGIRLSEYQIEGNILVRVMATDSEGNLYLMGDFMNDEMVFWEGTTIAWDENSLNSFMAKIEPTGTVAWSLNMSQELGTYASAHDISFRDGAMYVAFSNWPNSFVASVDGSGNTEIVIEQELVGILSSLDFDTQGNLYVTGGCSGASSLFNGVNYPAPFTYVKYLAKYGPDGIPEWVEFSEDVTCIHPRVRVDQEDHIYWTGLLNNPCLVGSIQLDGPSWVYDFYLSRLDPDGNALWAVEVPDGIAGDASIGKLGILEVLPDNSVAIAGFSRGTVDWGNGITTQAIGYTYDVLVINYDQNGVTRWAKSAGGTGFDNTDQIAVDASGALYLAGVAHDTVAFDEQTFYLESYYYPFIAKLETDLATGTDETMVVPQRSLVYPNPASEQVSIQRGEKEIDRVSLLSQDGKVIRESLSGTTLSLSGMAPGFYLVRVIFTDGTLGQEKLFVRR